jgi:Uncharacterised nucleotidyltransferase
MTETGVRAALRAVAARSLGSRARAPHGDVDAQWLLAELSRQRLTGLAIEAVTSGDLALGSGRHVEDLFERHDEQMALDLRLERMLCDATDVLHDASIEYRVLKGPVLAHTVYRDPALRSFGDVDVLVRDADFDAAIDELRVLGFHRRFVEPRPGFDARFAKGACLERADGLELDLHRTFAPGAFGLRLARLDLFAPAPRWFAIGASKIAGLDDDLAFVHACFHAALGDDPPRLVPLRDVAELVRSDVDVPAALERVAGVGCALVLQRALALVEQELQVDLAAGSERWSEMHPPTRFDRWILKSYGAERSYASQAAVSFWTMSSLRDRAAFAHALAFPSRSYVRARGRGYTRRLADSVRLARDWRPR